MKVCINAGHGKMNSGRYDPGAIGPTGYKEATQNLEVAKLVAEKLLFNGHDVHLIQDGDLSDIGKKANELNADYFISIHANASVSPSAAGVECYALAPGGYGEKMARAIVDELAKATGFRNRGVKFANFQVLRDTKMPAVLIEAGFISNPAEEAQMKTSAFDEAVAEAICIGFSKAVGVPYGRAKVIVKDPKVPILGPATATVEQAKTWARKRGATEQFIANADIYWDKAPKLGINPVVAYAQYSKETNKGLYTGNVPESYNNPCGLKTIKASGDRPEDHKKFASWEEGITAHLDHLALYAGVAGYPKADSPDERQFSWIAGKVKTVEELGGKWAPSLTYGEEIIRLMREIEDTPALEHPKENEVIANLRKELQIEHDRRVATELELEKAKQRLDEYKKFFNTLKIFMERTQGR